MTFKRAFLRWHAAAGQSAEDAVEKHIDTTVDLELAIHEARKHAEELTGFASKVIAEKELAQARLTKAQRTVTEAENNAKAAVGVEKQKREAGDEAGADAAHKQAVLMATQVAGARSAIAPYYGIHLHC